MTIRKLFDENYYLKQNPDVAAAVQAMRLDAWDHFSKYGAAENRSPAESFHSAFYLSQSPDIAGAVEAGLISATQHFLLYGQNEPRSISPAVNLATYLQANPDIAQAVRDGQLSALDHLLTYGLSEGRNLGNGIELDIFKNDASFRNALEVGNLDAALMRIDAVAPFLPSFVRPLGWKPDQDTPIPIDFIPPAGTKLVVPPEVNVPAGMQLPDTFEPVTPPGPGGGDTPPATFTVTVDSGAVTFGGTATGNIALTVSGNALTFSRGGVEATTKPAINDLVENIGISALPGVTMDEAAFNSVKSVLAAGAATISGAITTQQTSVTSHYAKIKAGGITAITYADDASLQAATAAIASNAIAADAITLTAGAITTAQDTVLTNIAKFKADQITAISLANDAAIQSAATAIAHQAVAAESITLTNGTITTATAAVLANITKFKEGQITSLSLSASEFSNFSDATALNLRLATSALTVNAETAQNTTVEAAPFSKGITLNGNIGQDKLTGGDGNDVISGGAGADDVRGGSGSDAFIQRATDGIAHSEIEASDQDNFTIGDIIRFNNGVDTIGDFAAGAGGDVLRLQISSAATSGMDSSIDRDALDATTNYFLSGTWNAADSTFTVAAVNNGADTLVFQGAGGTAFDTNTSSVILVGVQAQTLTQDNFAAIS